MREVTATLSFRNQAGRRAWAMVCLIHLLALLVFTSSPALHKLIHPDADSADHECAITMLVHGQVSASVPPPILVAFVAAVLFLLPLLESAVFSSFDYLLSPSRAPPLV